MGVDYDGMWKGIIEEVAEDLLRFVFPQAEEVFDLERGCEFLDKELNELNPEPGVSSGKRYVDKLIKVYRKDGDEEWLLLHVEVQSKADKTFAERMFRYYYRIFDRYHHPVTAIAIFTGEDKNAIPDRYYYNFMGTELSYKYNTLFISDYPDEVLAQNDNLFALVLLVAKKAILRGKIDDVKLLEDKLSIADLLYNKGLFTNDKIRSILLFLDNLLVFSKPEINHIFNVRFDLITEKINTMGILEYLAVKREKEGLERGLQQGREQGRNEKQRVVIENLLSGTEFSDEKIASLAEASVELVKIIREELRRK